MAVWQGLPPQTPPFSVKTTANDFSPTSTDTDADAATNPWRAEDGSGVRWWSTEGVDVLARHCSQANSSRVFPCIHNDADEDGQPDDVDPADGEPDAFNCEKCAEPRVKCEVGGHLNFQKFNVDKTLVGCTHPVNNVDYRAQVAEQLDVDQWNQVGRALVGQRNGLSDTAEDTSGGVATDSSDAISHLAQVYSDVGLGIPGVIVMPANAVFEYLHTGALVREGGRVSTVTGQLVVSGPGVGNVGPGGLVAPAGHAWLYITPFRPVVAVHPGNQWTLNGRNISGDPREFWDSSLSCFEPGVRRHAIAVTSPCANYAVLADLRDCNGCAPADFPTDLDEGFLR